MIKANISELKKILTAYPPFKFIHEFIELNDLSSLKLGKIIIDEDRKYINIVEIDLKEKEEQHLEAHKQYIDFHIPISNEEIYGWKNFENCTMQKKEYEAVNDSELFDDIPEKYFIVKPGEFVVFFPEDAHAPAIGKGKIKKLIAKIRI